MYVHCPRDQAMASKQGLVNIYLLIQYQPEHCTAEQDWRNPVQLLLLKASHAFA